MPTITQGIQQKLISPYVLRNGQRSLGTSVRLEGALKEKKQSFVFVEIPSTKLRKCGNSSMLVAVLLVPENEQIQP